MAEPDGEPSCAVVGSSAPDVAACQDTLFLDLYAELCRLAADRLRRERPDHTMDATALVHEVYLRMVGHRETTWAGRAHFFAAAAEAMRRILIEDARARTRRRRGGSGGRAPVRLSLAALGVAEIGASQDPHLVFALDAAIGRMAVDDARMAAVVRLRLFTGLSIRETARTLGVSERTVKREWTSARTLLRQRLRDDES